MTKKITIFIVPPFDCSIASGGAENICRILCLSLAKQYNITVLHSESDVNQPLGVFKKYSERLCSCNAFYLDNWTRERGEISPKFCLAALKILEESSLLISFERTIKGIQIPQITVLGGISYIHCIDIATSKEWDKLVVPSTFLKKQCGELRNSTDNIHIVYNGINCSCFFKYNGNKTHMALLPFRPDKGKGYFEAIQFISIVNKLGKWGQYDIMITRMEDTSFSDFYDEIDRYAEENNVTIKYIPWSESNSMNDIYNKADFVLALGDLEEGFGLTTIESVLSGRPVIARDLGATSEVLPIGYGTLFIDLPVTDRNVTSTMETINSQKMQVDLSAGSNFIRSKYNEDRMSEELLVIIKDHI